MFKNAIAITNVGVEEFTQTEIKEIINKTSKTYRQIVKYQINDLEEYVKFSLKSQTITNNILLLDTITFTNFEDLEQKFKESINKINFEKIINNSKITFRLSSTRFGKHDFNSQAIRMELGIILNNKLKSKFENLTVDLKEPDLDFKIVITDNTAFFGIDAIQLDLSKRDYKIFNTKNSLSGPIGFSTIMFSNIKENESCLDPIAGNGIIPIELALWKKGTHNIFRKYEFQFNNNPLFEKINLEKIYKEIYKDTDNKNITNKIYCFDSNLKNLKHCKSNSKAAEVNKNITFSKLDIDWLDTKFDEGKIDKIICQLPVHSKTLAKIKVKKIYNKLFYQAEFILNDKGSINIIALKKDLIIETAKENLFKLKELKEIYSKHQKYYLIKLKKDLKAIEEKNKKKEQEEIIN